MPKAAPTLYNHNERPSTARILSVGTAPSGRRNLSSRANNVVVPEPAAAPSEPEYYAMDFDVDLEDISSQEATSDTGNMNEEPQPQESGVKGIQVKLPKAKRYTNSVRFIL